MQHPWMNYSLPLRRRIELDLFLDPGLNLFNWELTKGGTHSQFFSHVGRDGLFNIYRQLHRCVPEFFPYDYLVHSVRLRWLWSGEEGLKRVLNIQAWERKNGCHGIATPEWGKAWIQNPWTRMGGRFCKHLFVIITLLFIFPKVDPIFMICLPWVRYPESQGFVICESQPESHMWQVQDLMDYSS